MHDPRNDRDIQTSTSQINKHFAATHPSAVVRDQELIIYIPVPVNYLLFLTVAHPPLPAARGAESWPGADRSAIGASDLSVKRPPLPRAVHGRDHCRRFDLGQCPRIVSWLRLHTVHLFRVHWSQRPEFLRSHWQGFIRQLSARYTASSVD